jgi:hypothetical protein
VGRDGRPFGSLLIPFLPAWTLRGKMLGCCRPRWEVVDAESDGQKPTKLPVVAYAAFSHQ